MATATARLLEEIVSVGTILAVRFDDARRELEVEQRQKSEVTESPMLTDRLESLEKLLNEMREENISNISGLKNELAAERAAKEEKEKEVAALSTRLSQAESLILHQKEETCKLWEAISQDSCQSTTGTDVQNETRVTMKEMGEFVTALVANTEEDWVQQKEETRRIWEAIFVASQQRPTIADGKYVRAHEDAAVVELTSNDGPITDLGFLRLPSMKSLKSLNVCPPLHGTAWTHLYTLTWLEELKLELSGVTDSVIMGIRNLMNLRRLELIDTRVTDAGLAHLTCLGSLKVLFFSSNNEYACAQRKDALSSAGMLHVGKLTNLEALDIGMLNVRDDGLAHLVPLSKLTWLSLPKHITDQGMEHLRCFRSLKTIWLRSRYAHSLYAIECLKALPCLQKVGVQDSHAAGSFSRELPHVNVTLFSHAWYPA